MRSMVVAYDKNRGIGADNDLLWQRDLPGDLAHFRELTRGKSIVMGRKTFESIGRVLPDRQSIVLSRSNLNIDGVTGAASLEEAYEKAEHEVAVIGGGSVFGQALKDVDVIYATEVDASFPQATVFFPPLDAGWREIDRVHHDADAKDKYAYDFVTYQRVA